MEQSDAIVIDGCAILWVWPSKGSVEDLVTNFVKYVKGKLKGGTRVHIIFDRYCEYSIKSGTRCSRKAQVSREHQLCLSSPLPPQQVALTVTKNNNTTHRRGRCYHSSPSSISGKPWMLQYQSYQ